MKKYIIQRVIDLVGYRIVYENYKKVTEQELQMEYDFINNYLEIDLLKVIDVQSGKYVYKVINTKYIVAISIEIKKEFEE